MAVVEELRLELQDGLNVLSGETGAGKSIIIDAVGLLLGRRSSQEYLRSGAEKAVIEGVFRIGADAFQKLKSFGLDFDDDVLILTREILSSGRSTCRVNGRTVPLNVFQAIGETLITIHGQHEFQFLFSREHQTFWLDSFGGEEQIQIRESVCAVYRLKKEIEDKLSDLSGNVRDRARQQDLLSYQLQEIDDARLSAGEEEELRQQEKVLANAEKLMEEAAQVYKFLTDDHLGIYDMLARTADVIREMAQIDDRIGEVKSVIESCLYQIDDAARQMSDYLEQVEFDPQALTNVQNRLNLIDVLRKKYGDNIKEILLYREEIAATIKELENSEEKAVRLEKELQAAENDYRELNGRLAQKRRLAAEKMKQEINKHLAGLKLQGAAFDIVFKNVAEGPWGSEEVEFYFAPNKGEPAKPLAKIASGGELSRVMLAVKACLAKVDAVPTLIFDEIDTGVGGSAVQAVGSKLHELAKNHQVLCVTHAAQIASQADSHYKVFKEVKQGRTQTFISFLSLEKRIEEIARMLAGDSSPTALKHAEELLASLNVKYPN